MQSVAEKYVQTWNGQYGFAVNTCVLMEQKFRGELCVFCSLTLPWCVAVSADTGWGCAGDFVLWTLRLVGPGSVALSGKHSASSEENASCSCSLS